MKILQIILIRVENNVENSNEIEEKKRRDGVTAVTSNRLLSKIPILLIHQLPHFLVILMWNT